MGVLCYNPEQVRSMTFVEFQLAMKGYMAANGVKSPEEKYVSRNELLTLMGK